MMNKRRHFMIATASSLLSGYSLAKKPTVNLVQESDPSAIALGYVSNIRNIDTKKYPQFTMGQYCASCTLFQGTAKDATAPYLAFGGSAVSSRGWCSAWVKKA